MTTTLQNDRILFARGSEKMTLKSEKANAILVLKRNKGDYACINFLDLPSSLGINAITIEEFDNYTKNYTEESIVNEITTLNLVEERYKKGTLELLVDNDYLLPVLTKDVYNNLNLISFIEDNFNNKVIMNTIYNFIVGHNYLNKELNELLNNSIKCQDLNGIFMIINFLTYMEYRYLFFYVYKKYYENNKSYILNRERKQD